MAEVFSRVKLNAGHIAAIVLFVVVSSVAQMAIPSMLSRMIDDGVSGHSAGTVVAIAVAQGGTNFSGGQRQRLAIARAVMKKPEIYIFGDSFSALDMRTDRQVRQNLKESMGDATMIVVAQRVNTIRDATRILVLEDGAVAGMGTHVELLKSCRLYREIAEIQLGEREVQDEIARA